MEKREPKNNLEYRGRRVLILGVSGTGKTTLASRLIYTHPAQTVLVYDWQGGEFTKRLGAASASSRDELARRIDDQHRVICYKAEKGERDVKGEGFHWFCGMAFELAGQVDGRTLVTVDECQELIDPWNIPEPLGDILSRGRRREMDTCLIGRSANALHTEGRDQVTELYCFRLIDGNSLKYPASVGLDIERVQALPNDHFIFKDMTSGRQEELALQGIKRSTSK